VLACVSGTDASSQENVVGSLTVHLVAGVPEGASVWKPAAPEKLGERWVPTSGHVGQ